MLDTTTASRTPRQPCSPASMSWERDSWLKWSNGQKDCQVGHHMSPVLLPFNREAILYFLYKDWEHESAQEVSAPMVLVQVLSVIRQTKRHSQTTHQIQFCQWGLLLFVVTSHHNSTIQSIPHRLWFQMMCQMIFWLELDTVERIWTGKHITTSWKNLKHSEGTSESEPLPVTLAPEAHLHTCNCYWIHPCR